MPITDWKDASGADVDRRTLPDGRHMEVFIPGNLVIKWWWQLVLPSFDIEAQGRAETRSEAIAAVERAAGIPPAQAQASQASESFGPYSAAEVAVEWPSPFDDAQAREVMPRSYLVNAAALPEGASLFEAFKYPPQTPMEASVARGRFCRRLSVAGLPECRLPLGHEGAHITAYVETEELMDRCATMLREQGAASVARDGTFDLLQSFDARDWAREFVERAKRIDGFATDEGTMISWFANALMRGFDERGRRADADRAVAKEETDTLRAQVAAAEAVTRDAAERVIAAKKDRQAAEAQMLAQVDELESLRAQVQALTEENSQARAAIVEFQNASGLCVPPEEDGGDPGGVKPKHVERYIAKTEKERDAALADLRDMTAERDAAETLRQIVGGHNIDIKHERDAARALAYRLATDDYDTVPLSMDPAAVKAKDMQTALAFEADGSGK